jgi:hypothetical protein
MGWDTQVLHGLQLQLQSLNGEPAYNRGHLSESRKCTGKGTADPDISKCLLIACNTANDMRITQLQSVQCPIEALQNTALLLCMHHASRAVPTEHSPGHLAVQVAVHNHAHKATPVMQGVISHRVVYSTEQKSEK